MVARTASAEWKEPGVKKDGTGMTTPFLFDHLNFQLQDLIEKTEHNYHPPTSIIFSKWKLRMVQMKTIVLEQHKWVDS
jgi:hypothetical protein